MLRILVGSVVFSLLYWWVSFAFSRRWFWGIVLENDHYFQTYFCIAVVGVIMFAWDNLGRVHDFLERYWKVLLIVLLVSLFCFQIVRNYGDDWAKHGIRGVTGYTFSPVRGIQLHYFTSNVLHSVFNYEVIKLGLEFGYNAVGSLEFSTKVLGVVFLLLLILFGLVFYRKNMFAFLFLMFVGSHMIYFYGYQEATTLTFILLLLYFFTAYDYLNDNCSFWIPAFFMSVSLLGHLSNGWLLPSLVFLFFVKNRERWSWKFVFGVLAFVIPVILAFYSPYVELHEQGLVLSDLSSGVSF